RLVQAISISVAVILAVAGYVATYLNSLRLARRTERLELVNARLDRLYGPLYVASETAVLAYQTLLRRLGRSSVFDANDPPSEEQVREWRTWVEAVLIPLDDLREKLLIGNAHLIPEAEMPECLLRYLAWIYTSRAGPASGHP